LLLSELTTVWLEKNDPTARAKRRDKRKKRRVPRRADQKKPSRHISSAVRDAVYKRDGGRCTYVGADGKRCNSKWDMEIHHSGVPYARGGSHSINNLKLLCAAHNKLEAERVYGKIHADEYTNKQMLIYEAAAVYITSVDHRGDYRSIIH